MSNPTNVTKARRNAVVKRNGGQTYVIPAAIKTEDELAFAIRFLADHATYKRSKGSGVNEKAILFSASAIEGAFDSFESEVATPNGVDLDSVVIGETVTVPVSGLGQGVVRNPYDYLSD